MSDLPEYYGGVSTPLFESLKPIIPRLEQLSVDEIELEVMTAVINSDVSENGISRIHSIITGNKNDKTKLMIYVVNLALASEGMKALEFKIIGRL